MLEKTDFRSRFAQELYEKFYGKSAPKTDIIDVTPIPDDVQGDCNETYVPSSDKVFDTFIINNPKADEQEADSIKKQYTRIVPCDAEIIEPLKIQRPGTSFNDSGIQKSRYISLMESTNLINHRGIVGEERLIATSLLALANHMSYVVIGYSGSGKTYITDNILEFVPEKDKYRMELSSKMAAFHDMERMNESNIIYIPEMQKALCDKRSPNAELVKNVAEGRDAVRIITNDARDGTETLVVTKDKHFVGTLALENYFKMDAELSRRFLRLMTDASPDHIQQIHDYKADRRMSIDNDQEYYKDLEDRLKYHISTVRDFKQVSVLDPFASYIQDFIPKTQKSVSYVDHYYGLVDACAKFHYHDRETFKIDDKMHIIANIEDHYLVHELYFNQFQDALLGNLEDKPMSINPYALQRVIDWKRCFEQGFDALRGLPSQFQNSVERWKQSQLMDGKIMVKSFPTGKELQLAAFD